MAEFDVNTRKDAYGKWVSTSEFPLWGDKVLTIRTYKDDQGRLNTRASVSTMDPNRPGLMSFRVFGDYNRIVASSKPPRVTDTICKEQHMEVIRQQLAHIKDSAEDFYRAKGELA